MYVTWGCDLSPFQSNIVSQEFIELVDHLPFAFPKPQKDRDFAFSRRSLAAAVASADGASFPPNLKPDGIGAPLSGPEILTLPLTSNFSGDGTRSGAAGVEGTDANAFSVGWNDFRPSDRCSGCR
jgi:hypothetical protein